MDKENLLTADQIQRLNEVLHEISNESDRAAAILIGVEIDDALEKVIQAYLLPSLDRKDQLFRPDGPLGSLSSRIELAYRLGLISVPLQREAHLIRRIRNAFAHQPAGLTSNDAPVVDYCQELRIAQCIITGQEAIKNGLQLGTPRSRFTITGAVIIALLSVLPKRTNSILPKPPEFSSE